MAYGLKVSSCDPLSFWLLLLDPCHGSFLTTQSSLCHTPTVYMSAMGQPFLLPTQSGYFDHEGIARYEGRHIVVKDELKCDWSDFSISYNDIKIEGC